jgi:hypothetical protein
MKQRANAFSIVGNEHKAPPRFKGRLARQHNFSYRPP